MKQAELIEAIAQRVRSAKRNTDRSLEAWTGAHRAAEEAMRPVGGFDATAEGARNMVEAYRAEWQRTRDAYLEALAMYFEVASGALTNVEDIETRVAATAKALAYLRSPS